ncbi:hypothetical protein AB0465_18565 [Streptomyces griseoviridis]|uniref:hypothetical protein n=1 Tax=Streptomyces griseoviridis TaxID=45398 RepID=UPI00344DB5E7
MTTIDTEPPGLNTPESGSMSQPDSPAKWHAHPYVWAFHAIGGSLSTDYIESVCQQAEVEGAPPDVVYKTRGDDEREGEWITVGMIANADQQQRVRAYAKALVDWQAALKAHRTRPKVQPLQRAKPDEAAEQYEYTVAFTARISGTVKAASFREAMSMLAPSEHTGQSGYVGGLASSMEGVVWFLNFDPTRADMVSTSDPRVHGPGRQPGQVAPVSASPPGTSAPEPTTGVLVRRQPTAPPK